MNAGQPVERAARQQRPILGVRPAHLPHGPGVAGDAAGVYVGGADLVDADCPVAGGGGEGGAVIIQGGVVDEVVMLGVDLDGRRGCEGRKDSALGKQALYLSFRTGSTTGSPSAAILL